MLTHNSGVTTAEFWRNVGEALLLQRKRLKWNPIDVQRNGGPNYHTVETNESGQIGTMSKLVQHADALGVSLVDIFRAVLDRSAQPLSPEAALLVRTYERATVQGRQALLALAQALPDADAAPSGPRRLPNAPDRSARHKR